MPSTSRHLAAWLLCILQVVGKISSACRGVKGTAWDPMNITTCGADDNGVCDPIDGEGRCLGWCDWPPAQRHNLLHACSKAPLRWQLTPAPPCSA
jgi:hypothetical protein